MPTDIAYLANHTANEAGYSIRKHEQRLADIERAVVLLAAKLAGPFGVSLVDRHDDELMRIVQRLKEARR